MRTSVSLALLGILVIHVPMSAFAAEPTAPAISLQGICSNGLAVMMVNHPPKVPVVEDRSPMKEMAYWNEIKDSNDASLFLVYISNFQNGMFIEAAVEKYKRNCGDLTALPVGILSCLPGLTPTAKLPPKKLAFIPLPPKHRPIIKKVPVIYPDPFAPFPNSGGGHNSSNTGSQGDGNAGGTPGKP